MEATEEHAVHLLAHNLFLQKQTDTLPQNQSTVKNSPLPQGLARGMASSTGERPNRTHGTLSHAHSVGAGGPLRSNRSLKGGSGGGFSTASVPVGDDKQHPILALGFTPKCSVVCNGLLGEFLGGHDRDMFIQCTSGEYANLPLLDASEGGCIMTCSQFERAAGRELSKKWKESIHVVGEGEGSRATLISWIKRAANKEPYGTDVLGKQVWVCWCADAEYYQGTITAYNPDNGKHTIQYSPKLSEELHLPVELLSFDPVKPQLAAYFLSNNNANSSLTHHGSGLRKAITAPEMSLKEAAAAYAMYEDGLQGTIWHQGSGTSTTSNFETDMGPASPHANIPHKLNTIITTTTTGPSATAALAGGVNNNNKQKTGTVVGATRPASAAGALEPSPKRSCSAPASVILAAVAAAERWDQEVLAMTQKIQQQAAAMLTAATPSIPESAPLTGHLLPTVTPLQLHTMLSPSTTPSGAAALTPTAFQCGTVTPRFAPALPAVPVPPRTDKGSGYDAVGADVAFEWMHNVVLALDNDLQAAAASCVDDVQSPSPTTSPGGINNTNNNNNHHALNSSSTFKQTGNAKNVSVSGRFQTLLALGRREETWARGMYDAMASRYRFFHTDPTMLRTKMTDYIMAALYESAVHHDLSTGLFETLNNQDVQI